MEQDSLLEQLQSLGCISFIWTFDNGGKVTVRQIQNLCEKVEKQKKYQEENITKS